MASSFILLHSLFCGTINKTKLFNINYDHASGANRTIEVVYTLIKDRGERRLHVPKAVPPDAELLYGK